MQRLAPSSPVLPLAVAPFEEPAMEMPHLFPAPLLVGTKRGLGPVEILRGLLRDLRIIVFAEPLEFRPCFLESCLELLGPLPQFACFDAEGAVYFSALFVHLSRESLSADHAAEIAQRKCLLEENADFLADVVVKLPDDVRTADGHVHGHL